MTSFSEQVFNRIKSQSLKEEIEQRHINKILSSLDSEGRSVTEIARKAEVPPWMGRIVLNTAQEFNDSAITSSHMRFKLLREDVDFNSEITPNDDTTTVVEKITPLPKKAESPKKGGKNMQQIISSIITILHERPQTISSLSDEIDIDAKQCLIIVKNLEKENAVTQDLSTEWPEPLYMLDKEGYKSYIERVENKAKSTQDESHKTETSKPVEKPTKQKSESENEANNSIESMIFDIIKDKEQVKTSELVSETNTAITRVDIENAIEKLLSKGLIECDNPKKRHPLYSMVSNKPKKSTITTKKPQAKTLARVKNETPKKQPIKTIQAEEASGSKEIESSKKATQSKEEVKQASTKKTEQTTQELSIYSDIAALQLVLEDILPTLSDTKVSQINRAIKGIEGEKSKVKHAVSNLNKTINELM